MFALATKDAIRLIPTARSATTWCSSADQFKPFRDKLLQGAADFCGARLETLLEGQTDPASRKSLGQAYIDLGTLTATIGDKPAALAALRKGLAVRRELASEPAADARARVNLVNSLCAEASLLITMGNSAEALARYEGRQGTWSRACHSRSAEADDHSALLGGVYNGVGFALAVNE